MKACVASEEKSQFISASVYIQVGNLHQGQKAGLLSSLNSSVSSLDPSLALFKLVLIPIPCHHAVLGECGGWTVRHWRGEEPCV